MTNPPSDDTNIRADAALDALSEERRRGADRRQNRAEPGPDGTVKTKTYTGPDRRTGLDRRAYMERQRQMVRNEQSRFIQRSVITGVVFFILIVLAGVFLLAPEYLQLKRNADVAERQPAPVAVVAAPAPAPVPLGLAVNRQIQRAENLGAEVSTTTQAMVTRAGEASAAAAETARQLAAGDASGLRDLVEFIGKIHAMTKSVQGQQQLNASVDYLKAGLGNWQGDAAGFDRAIATARSRDPGLDSMLGSVAPQDVGAAAMLLLMGEFRSNLEGGRPFEQDMAVVQRLAGNNPGLQQSLQRLAPYAKNGVLTPATLQKEFKGLAMDIVTAKTMGQDVTVSDQAQARLQNLVKIRDAQITDGPSADAVVNRAQRLLDTGDVDGAVRELQTLQGAQAQAAAPFIAQAQGTLVADQSADMLITSVLSQLAAGGGVSVEGLKGLIGNSLTTGGPVSPVSGQ